MLDHIATFIVFFAVIDPIGTIPVFLAVTKDFSAKTAKKIALRASLISIAILLFFMVAGEYILDAMNIPLSAFRISGGIVLFIFALNMIFGEGKPNEEIKLVQDHKETAVFPLAVPSIAGPGAMLAAVLLTQHALYTIWQQLQAAAMMMLVVFITYLLMLSSGWINQKIGKSGASVISRIMGLILTAEATSQILVGAKEYFGI